MSEEMDLLKKIVQADLPAYEYFVPYRYRVAKVHVEDNYRVDLQIFKKKAGLPDLLPMIMVPGVSGFVSKLAEGSIVLVSFIEGDPSLPRIIGYADYQDPGFKPVTIIADTFSTQEFSYIEMGKNSDRVIFGDKDDLDQKQLARYPEIKRFCDNVVSWANSVQTVLTGLGATPPVPPPTSLTTAAVANKVTSI